MLYRCLHFFILIVLIAGCSKNDDLIIPIPPTNLIANSTSFEIINLTWVDNSTNEIGFKIERKIANGTYNEIGIVSSDITQFKDSLLDANTEYTYRIYAYNDAGKSITYSNQVSAKTHEKLFLEQSYGGGIIFYLDDTGKHGLIAAIKDSEYSPKGESTSWGIRTSWGCEDIITGATGIAIGTGKSNTLKIISLPCGMTNTPAAICNNLILESYSDWFLPSKDELAKIYDVLYLKKLGACRT